MPSSSASTPASIVIVSVWLMQMMWSPDWYVVELSLSEAQTASRRTWTILSLLESVARSQRPEPRQLMPRAAVLVRRVARAPRPRNEEVKSVLIRSKELFALKTE